VWELPAFLRSLHCKSCNQYHVSHLFIWNLDSTQSLATIKFCDCVRSIRNLSLLTRLFIISNTINVMSSSVRIEQTLLNLSLQEEYSARFKGKILHGWVVRSVKYIVCHMCPQTTKLMTEQWTPWLVRRKLHVLLYCHAFVSLFLLLDRGCRSFGNSSKYRRL